MNLSRLLSVIDVARMQLSHVTVIGSAPMLTSNLIRSGLGAVSLVDPQTVEPSNVARQDFLSTAIGLLKVEALADHLRRINPDVSVTCLPADFCALTDDQIDTQFASTSLFIAATDYFPAQARVNEVALRLGIPAIWIGLYAGARAGEIMWWDTDIDSCFRCLIPRRFKAHEQALREGRSIDPASDGADIFSIQLLDAIAGHIAIGLLTRGADNRFGRLIGQLGDRNFLQVKLDPGYTFAGRDIFREQLMIPADCDAYFTWNTIVRRDPDGGNLPCPDCERFRGVSFATVHGGTIRTRTGRGDPRTATAGRQQLNATDAVR